MHSRLSGVRRVTEDLCGGPMFEGMEVDLKWLCSLSRFGCWEVTERSSA